MGQSDRLNKDMEKLVFGQVAIPLVFQLRQLLKGETSEEKIMEFVNDKLEIIIGMIQSIRGSPNE